MKSITRGVVGGGLLIIWLETSVRGVVGEISWDFDDFDFDFEDLRGDFGVFFGDLGILGCLLVVLSLWFGGAMSTKHTLKSPPITFIPTKFQPDKNCDT